MGFVGRGLYNGATATVTVSLPTAGDVVARWVWTAPAACVLVGGNFDHTVAAGGAGTLNLFKVAAGVTGTAPGSGAAMATAVNLNATANTSQAVVPSATVADTRLAKGDRVGIALPSGTAGSVAGACYTLIFDYTAE